MLCFPSVYLLGKSQLRHQKSKYRFSLIHRCILFQSVCHWTRTNFKSSDLMETSESRGGVRNGWRDSDTLKQLKSYILHYHRCKEIITVIFNSIFAVLTEKYSSKILHMFRCAVDCAAMLVYGKIKETTFVSM